MRVLGAIAKVAPAANVANISEKHGSKLMDDARKTTESETMPWAQFLASMYDRRDGRDDVQPFGLPLVPEVKHMCETTCCFGNGFIGGHGYTECRSSSFAPSSSKSLMFRVVVESPDTADIASLVLSTSPSLAQTVQSGLESSNIWRNRCSGSSGSIGSRIGTLSEMILEL